MTRNVEVSVAVTLLSVSVPRLVAEGEHGFVVVPGPMPGADYSVPDPGAAPPANSTGLAFDASGNFWTLAPVGDGQPQLWVLPCGENSWRADTLSGIEPGHWRHVLMGGRTKEGGEVSYIYSPKTGKWRHGPGLPRELVWGAAFNHIGRLYITGGAAGRCYNNRTFVLR